MKSKELPTQSPIQPKPETRSKKMSTSIINDPDLALDRHDGNIFVITMRKGPENRLNSAYCQKLIAAFNLVRTTLGPDSEGAVITKGNDAKFWCTVSLHITYTSVSAVSDPLLRATNEWFTNSATINPPIPFSNPERILSLFVSPQHHPIQTTPSPNLTPPPSRALN